jgi:hypothetical protein
MFIEDKYRNKKLVHFAGEVYESEPVCGETSHPNTILLSVFREEVTCEKCKNTAQFIIPNFNRRFGIK